MDASDPEAVAREVFAALADPSRRGILAALAAAISTEGL
jgi:DNA-binding transcriptional ArsR family regulator